MTTRAPLVPAEVDLRAFPFTPLFRSRLFGSSFHARSSDAEWRAGVTLWLKSWDQVPAGSLPDDEVDLCRLAELGRDIKAFRRTREGAMRGWIKCSDGRLYHPVVAEGVLEAWERHTRQVNRGKAGASKRWGQSNSGGYGGTSGHASGVASGGGNASANSASMPAPMLADSKGQGQGQGQGQKQQLPGEGLDAEQAGPAWQVVRDFVSRRERHWPSESRLPAPMLTIQTQAQEFLDAGGTPALIAEILERGMAKSASQGRSAPASLAAYRDSLADGIAQHRRGVVPLRPQSPGAPAAPPRRSNIVSGSPEDIAERRALGLEP